jgi:undecaprenyl-diphosphatase
MTSLRVIVLAIVQGLAELLPVSSSAHVVVAERLMGLDPSAPDMTLLLVMLHTGTMLAVIAYFWRSWKASYFSNGEKFRDFLVRLLWATVLTGIIGEALKKTIEKTLFRGAAQDEIELLFSRLDLIAPALAGAGLLILLAGLLKERHMTPNGAEPPGTISVAQSSWMGIVQGLALPFRGFSRSGSTISVGMLAGAAKESAERFSFAMAVVLTPVVVGIEALRLKHAAGIVRIDVKASVLSSLLGMVFSFLAGLVALRWLSRWLEKGRWYLFGIYCLIASGVVWYLHLRGF